jgi:autotransporter-associated beta strand protein
MNPVQGRVGEDTGVVLRHLERLLGKIGTLAAIGLTLQLGANFDLSSSRAITLNGGGGTFDINSFNTTAAQTISGAGALTKSGSGIVTLSAANTYSDGTSLNGGTLKVSAENNLGAATGGRAQVAPGDAEIEVLRKTRARVPSHPR